MELNGKLEAKYQHHKDDTGSIEVQIIQMNDKINMLVEHFKTHKFDFSSRRGLTRLVNRRRNYLDYIKNKNQELYKKIINDLGLRK